MTPTDSMYNLKLPVGVSEKSLHVKLVLHNKYYLCGFEGIYM